MVTSAPRHDRIRLTTPDDTACHARDTQPARDAMGVRTGASCIVRTRMVAATFTVFERALVRSYSSAPARTNAVNKLVVGEPVYLFNVH